LLIGIISDTHNNLANIVKAINIFKEKKVEMAIHCGDVTSQAAVDYFKGMKVLFVKGNCDMFTAKNYGDFEFSNVIDTILDDKKIFVIHGNDKRKLEDHIKSGKYDYVFTGHTHQTADYYEGKTRVLNPGSHKMGENNIIVLDTKNNTADFITILRG
jgi:hypothetical protein